MADEILDDGKTQSAGGSGTSTPGASDESQQLPEWAKALAKRVDEAVTTVRGVQKGVDKQIVKGVDSSIERILELSKAGKSATEIKRELWIDSQIGGSDSVEPSPAVSDKGAAVEDDKALYKAVDDLLQLPANDSRVTQLKLDHGKDFEKYRSEAFKLALKLHAGQEEATPGEQPVASGGGAAPKVDNPIANIDDPKTLYRMAAQQMAKSTGKKRVVPS